MSSIKAATLKGFRDFLPEQANAREFVVGKIKETFKVFGFEPIETPALEYEEVLAGKYGEEGEKLMYRFTDNGGRKVAMRYDQTVPLARVVAQYPELPKPFKRYQIQTVWRADNPQKGRFREFLMCDVDIVGTDSSLADAEVIITAAKVLENLGFKNFKILVNDRSIFSNLVQKTAVSENELPTIIRSIDKLKKIGREGVIQELEEKGFPSEKAANILQTIENYPPTERLQEIISYLKKLGLSENQFEFSPTLARGLEYYTSTIIEIEAEGYTAGSIAGGGRYDKLIGLYSGNDQPAVGFAFGFDRVIEAMEELNLLPKNASSAKVLVTVFSPELLDKSLEVSSRLRSNNINTELWLDPESKLDKQLKYADQKGIPFAIIIGPNEARSGKVTLKNLTEKTQETITEGELFQKF